MKYLALVLVAASLVAGHGYVTNATINGVFYELYQPNKDPYMSPKPDRISRPVQGDGPVTDVTSADIQCGGSSANGVVGSKPAALHAPATPGSKVTLWWTPWATSHYGSLMTYMARCPDTGCQDYMPGTDSVWFKIDEVGITSTDGAAGRVATWGTTPLMQPGNAGYTYTIPACLADGFYLVRHEIFAVFLAGTYPGAQAYPGCHQLQLTGAGAGATTVADGLVAFPGAYAPTDPGVTWDSASTTYPIPGPPVFRCPSAGGGGTAESGDSC